MTDLWLRVADVLDPAGRRGAHPEIETDWRTWVASVVPTFVSADFAAHHRAIWDWAWALEPGQSADPLVAVVFRGGAKSTTSELAVAMAGATGRRRYCLYVCGTQDQANDHLDSIKSVLESPAFVERYPEHARPLLTNRGTSRGWRQTRLRTAGGFTIDALGLDSGARGIKLDDARPDLIVLDDIDDEHDTARAVNKKIRTITTKLLPAGARHLAVLAVQNLIHDESVFARLVDGRADFLATRTVIGPVPAVEDLEWEERDGRYVITGGRPTWDGYPLSAAQQAIDTEGLTAFLVERQHELEPPDGGMFGHIAWRRCDPDEIPWDRMLRTVVWVDPAVTSTDQSDSQGIQADGITDDGVIYRLRSWEGRTSPVDAIERAIRWALDLGAAHVGIETDQGGDTWRSVYREAAQRILAERDPDLPNDVQLTDAEIGEVAALVRPDGSHTGIPGFRYEKAGAGHGPKAHRASLMLADYERPGRIVHVRGTHLVLERALRRFPLVKPYDLVDAAFWAWQDLSKPPPRYHGTGARAAAVRVSTGVR